MTTKFELRNLISKLSSEINTISETIGLLPGNVLVRYSWGSRFIGGKTISDEIRTINERLDLIEEYLDIEMVVIPGQTKYIKKPKK
jgi:hypothetical protein